MRSLSTLLALPVIVAAVTTSLPNVALAQTSTATVNHLRVTVIDLDLNDGIVAAVSLTPGSTALRSTTYAPNDNKDSFLQLATISAPTGTLSVGDNVATASATSFGGNLLSASGWSGTAKASTALYDFTGPVEAEANVYLSAFFAVTAHTMLVVTADTQTFTSSAFGSGAAGAEIFLTDLTYTNQFSSSSPGPLRVSFANTSGSSTNGFFDVQLWASASAQTALPVPEPQSAMLLAIGLGAVGFVARRRLPR